MNFVKFTGNVCKVFAANKQVRDSTVFLYQIAGILLLLSTTINFWYHSKDFVLTVPKNLSGFIKRNNLNFMSIVYIKVPETVKCGKFSRPFCGAIGLKSKI